MKFIKIPSKKQLAVEFLLGLMCALGIYVAINHSELFGVTISMMAIMIGVLLWYFDAYKKFE